MEPSTELDPNDDAPEITGKWAENAWVHEGNHVICEGPGENPHDNPMYDGIQFHRLVTLVDDLEKALQDVVTNGKWNLSGEWEPRKESLERAKSIIGTVEILRNQNRREWDQLRNACRPSR